MQNDVDVPQSDDPGPLVEFEDYEAEPSRYGFNPRARGYRKAAGQRRVLLVVLCLAAALISSSLLLCQRLSAWPAVLGMAVSILVVAAVEWSCATPASARSVAYERNVRVHRRPLSGAPRAIA